MDPHGYAAQPRRAQKYSTRNVKQQPLTRWWAHTNIPRAYLMLQANTHDQSLGQEIIGEFSGAPPGASILGCAPPDPTTVRLRTCYIPKPSRTHTFLIKTKRY